LFPLEYDAVASLWGEEPSVNESGSTSGEENFKVITEDV
jgi:hypothetical protein